MNLRERKFLDHYHSTKPFVEAHKDREQRTFNTGWDEALKSRDHLFKHFTCHTCPQVETCEWAWDMYNTNGDCLADK